MPAILDTGILYAYYDRRDAWHGQSVDLVKRELGALIVPAPVIPEADFLLGDRLGRQARTTFYSGLVDGSYLVADLPRDGCERIRDLNDRFADLDLGFVDAAVVVIAQTLELFRIATTDRRHFEALRKPLGLELLP